MFSTPLLVVRLLYALLALIGNILVVLLEDLLNGGIIPKQLLELIYQLLPFALNNGWTADRLSAAHQLIQTIDQSFSAKNHFIVLNYNYWLYNKSEFKFLLKTTKLANRFYRNFLGLNPFLFQVNFKVTFPWFIRNSYHNNYNK